MSAIFLVAATALTGMFRLAPEIFTRLRGWPPWLVAGGLGLGVALVLVLAYAVMDMLLREKPQAATDLADLIHQFNQRTLGVIDETTLAQATADILQAQLTVRTSGWLLLTPHDSALAVQPVAGQGDFPVLGFELTRQNALVRQLTERHEPVSQAELEADAQAGQTPPAERQWLKQLRAELYAPVFEGGLLTAILVIGPRDGRRPFRPADRKAAALLAAQAGLAWKAVRQQSEVRQMQATVAEMDVRLRLKDEAVSKMDSSRSDFLAIASHELRTPITQLLGFADLLGSMVQDHSLDLDTVKHVTDSIVRACGRLNEVIGQILDMAQLDVNALDLKFKKTSVDVILRQAVEPYVNTLRDRRLALKINGLKGLPLLEADEQRLIQAFSQLMSNAIKYTPDGGKIDINLRLLPAEDTRPASLEVVFADGGIGIDPQYHDLIFDKFFRIGAAAQHSTSTTKFMGAGPGLGLPIARGVVERHGGHLWVESEGCDPARLPGSRFVVRLPLKPPAFDPRALAAVAQPPSEPGTRMYDSRPNIPRTPFIDS